MKTFKRVLNIIMVILTVTLLWSCNSEGAKKAQRIREIKIGVTLYKESDLFISSIAENLIDIAKEKESSEDIKIILNIADSNGSTVNETKQVEKFINQKYDVICVNLVDRTAASTIIDKAKLANIPVIFFNREPVEEDMQRWNKIYYVGAEAEKSGKMQAEIILDAYKENSNIVDKNSDGKIQYVMLEGEAGHQDSSIRTEYCIKSMIENGLEVEKLSDDIANWENSQAREKMIQWIKSYGDDIEVVFSNNDDMALGAINAYDSLNIDIVDRPLIVGVDGIQEALQQIKEGKMIGTVISDAKEQASAIFNIAFSLGTNGDIDECIDLLDGKYFKVKHTKVLKENVELFYN